jgi:hypothetical protein
MLYCERETYKI